LQKKRNCAWSEVQPPPSQRAVWARGDVLTTQCPKSIITAESLSFLDEFQAWKQLGSWDPSRLNAKSADALMILEEAWKETCREQIEKQFNGPR
jgi:hypothetical protein